MEIKQGDQFHVQDGGAIEVTYVDMNTVKYRHIHGSSKKGEIALQTFEQFISNSYFKAVQ